MPTSSSTQAAACLRAALRAGAENPRAGLGTGIAALILALLVRLFGRTEAAWFLSPNTPNDHTPQAITMPAIGRAPHAEFIETGRVPDWILPGIRNRGMHPSPHRAPPRRNTHPARAPPPRLPRTVLKSPLHQGALIHAHIHCNIISIALAPPPRLGCREHPQGTARMATRLKRHPITLLLALSLLATPAAATEPGWRALTITPPDSPPIPVALYYPTQATPRPIPMGPFTPNIAIQAPPDPTVKALIILSHGTGGSELAHSSVAEALARQGYLVAALRHPGDNYQDRSLLQQNPARFLAERPKQASRVIDAILADPLWKDRITRDAKGPRIGAIGHSAGGYTVLALAGAEPDVTRITRHCETDRAEDPIFCAMTRPPSPTATTESVADPRIRAIVALAPLGVMLTAPSLARINIPVAIYTAEQDRFLVPRFHAEWVAANIPTAAHHRVPNAWHFAFVDPPRTAIPSEDGDLRADPPGFDRPALLQQLARDIPAFFDRALQ